MEESTAPVILVTAGSAGLGAAAVRLFAKHGYRVVVNYSSNAERATKLLNELLTLSGITPNDEDEDLALSRRFVAIRADLGSRDEIARLVRETVKRFGRLDIVFSNGGWTRARGMVSIDDNCFEDEWDRAFNMNVKAHLWLMQAARAHLDETEGAFVTTASLAGVNHSGSSLVRDSERALEIWSNTMAAPKIRVNSVSPGLLLTEWAEKFTDEQKEAHLQKTKLKRIVTVEDVAEQVLTFAKSRSMTGVNVLMDAGFVL
ncbi:Uu.00g045830.m01.CDS01 [Anthostomella pinea]|uniref:Uu.00g045830.m01.CDS01 n=1 Tax=Anthostomella pinea TaxID=933095 RepID=A0AAI8VC70_9PEZI|nr:Uu.00g045830.m01.CDS01 [Anthostomella pinea]